MRTPSCTHRGFTLIEMLVVMAVIALLAAIILNVNGLVQSKAARSRAEVEIQALAAGCESYKADNGSYPQEGDTDILDPRTKGNPADYKKASLYLYKQLSGDLDANGRNDPNAATPEPKSYLADFFTPQRLAVKPSPATPGTAGYVLYIKDPYGNSYGYSTKGLAAEQKFRKESAASASAKRANTAEGYNSTFDLWSTAGKTKDPSADPTVTNVWVKNW